MMKITLAISLLCLSLASYAEEQIYTAAMLKDLCDIEDSKAGKAMGEKSCGIWITAFTGAFNDGYMNGLKDGAFWMLAQGKDYNIDQLGKLESNIMAMVELPIVKNNLVKYCHEGRTNEQRILVVKKYLREHPEKLHLPANTVVLDALAEAFPPPCKNADS